MSLTRADLQLHGYVNVDFNGNTDSGESIIVYIYSGWYCYVLGLKLVKDSLLSTKKAEYVAMSKVSKEMIWLQSLLEELGKKTRTTLSIMIVRVLYSSPRILHFILETNIFRLGIISFDLYLMIASWYLSKSVEVRTLMICWQRVLHLRSWSCAQVQLFF